MQMADTDKQKLKYYDDHVAQKYIDDMPKSILNIRLKEFFSSVCNKWIED